MGGGEVYATIVVYDGPYACSAAVLGSVLRRLDAKRRRVALIYNVSAETVAMLTADQIWEVHQMPHPFVLPQSALWSRRPPLWGFQAQLWSLPFRRVLFFDADHMPLPDTPPARLLQLWDHHAGLQSLAAILEGTPQHGCFNSGLMMLRPRLSMLHEIGREATQLQVNTTRMSPSTSLRLLRERCPTGWNLDQPLLNAVFRPGHWTQLTAWRAATPYSVSDICNVSVETEAAPHMDSFHFMHPVRPWEQSSRCALFGAGCGAATNTAGVPDCHLWGTVSTMWWTNFLQLPSATRKACQMRLPSTSTVRTI